MTISNRIEFKPFFAEGYSINRDNFLEDNQLLSDSHVHHENSHFNNRLGVDAKYRLNSKEQNFKLR